MAVQKRLSLLPLEISAKRRLKIHRIKIPGSIAQHPMKKDCKEKGVYPDKSISPSVYVLVPRSIDA